MNRRRIASHPALLFPRIAIFSGFMSRTVTTRCVVACAASLAWLLPATFPDGVFASEASVTSILGVWYTQDREGGVELYPCDSKICGRLYWLKDDTGSRDEN